MRILLPALRSNPLENKASRAMAFFAVAIALFMAGAKPALANHISTAQATTSCTSYTIQLTANSLAAGKSYTMTYTMTYTPTSGAATVVTGSVAFVAPSNGTYSATLTKPVNLISNTYKLTGTASLMGVNTINIAFTPTTLACDCPD